MNQLSKKLIIWDFDGVLADSEKFWIQVWQEAVNEHFGLKWDYKTADKYFGGIALKTRVSNLAKIGIEIDDVLLEEIRLKEFAYIKNMVATAGAEKVLQQLKIPYVLATGGTRIKTEAKLAATKLKKYFPDEHIFTAEQVVFGKPAPDLFLLVAQQMGVKPDECLVIEDSIPGFKAAQAAGMDVIAFIGGEMNNTHKYRKEVEALGIKNIFCEMDDLYLYLSHVDK